MKFLSRHWKTALKIAIVLALLYFLAEKGFLSLDATRRAFSRWDLVIPAFSFLVVASLLGILRWHILLRTQGILLPWWRTFQLALIGLFFNIALPGAVSGDVIKAVYVSREVHGNRARALASILFDRVIGVSALVVLAGLAWTSGMFFGVDSNLLQSVDWFVLTATLCVLVFFLYLNYFTGERDFVMTLFRKLEQKHVRLSSLTRIYEGVRSFSGHKRVMAQIFGLSLACHGLVTLACLHFAWAIGESAIPPLGIFVATPLGLLVTAVPVAPAGVGTGHAAFLALFMLLGSQRGADVFSLFVLYNLFQGLCGGLVYLKFRSKNQPADVTQPCA